MPEDDHDLRNPEHLGELYRHLLEQTINAYDPQHIVLAEGLQNAVDALREQDGADAEIRVRIDFDARTVTISDNGIGFPNDPTLLFLGGTRKEGRGLYGMIGAGLKVVLFSSSRLTLRARTDESHFRVDLVDAYRFRDPDSPPDLIVPSQFDVDPSPLEANGTELTYTFPEDESGGVFESAFQRIMESCIPHGADDPFEKALSGAVAAGDFPNRLAALLTLFLRRFTYVGDVRAPLEAGPAIPDARLEVELAYASTTSLPDGVFRELADDADTPVSFTVPTTYATAKDTYRWAPAPRIGLYQDRLGNGGRNLTKVAQGFNHLILKGEDDYRSLLLNSGGGMSAEARASKDEFEERLYPRINGIVLTIGRIPNFERCLPGGSRRLISANGVVTTHDLSFDRGQNQQYVRCFDMTIDVDANLNYGKTQITDMHLVHRVRRYANLAYAAVIQNAAKNFVGKIDPGDSDDENDVFLGRDDLGLADWVLQKEPTSEQDVIALMFELAGRGHLDGYQVYGLSQKDRYDGRAAIATEQRPKEQAFNPSDERDLRVIEFKHTAAKLINDFVSGAKDADDVDLLIAWIEGTSPSEHFHFEDIEHSRAFAADPSRVFPGVRRYIQDTTTDSQVQVVLLQDVVSELIEKAGADTSEAEGEKEPIDPD